RKTIDVIKRQMPELPDAKKERFIREYKLTGVDASVLVAERESAEFFESVARGCKDAKQAANWVIGELFGALNRENRTIADSPVTAAALAGLLDLIDDGTISGRIAKDVFALMVETGRDAASIVEEKGLRQVTDAAAIEIAIDRVIADNAAKVDDFRGGKQALFGWFVGQVMKATGGKANPAAVNEILKKKLAE
ncbi:MAG TPA: Asp-tRNA(Asn)/Glu-tRNA(Gln) amidotransferase GatCAB subunit B, partial [Alphaproteobacteria bacterium]|nr:Asp-tRNA(Asn)/Glu-tRNA(Gln) amidotransferase GatCAB subunit B [Alphaproteobacteria bacterium]